MNLGNIKIQYRQVFLLICLVVFILFSFGCTGIENNHYNDEQGKNTRLTISNFNFDGTPVELTFTKSPERVIVTRPEILDLLLELGVGDKVVGASFPLSTKVDVSQYKEKIPNTLLGVNEFDKETALMLHPDLIIGWRMSFRTGALGDTSYWRGQGVQTYIEENSGPIPGVDPFPPCTVDSEIQFIRNMGKIFGKEQIAEEKIKEIETYLALMESKAKEQKPKKVLTIEFMRDQIEVFGDKIISGDIIRRLGSENINYEVPFISTEQLRYEDPDVIFIVYHGDEADKLNAMRHLEREPISHIRAVREGKVYPLPYSYICATNIRTKKSIEAIYKGLYE